MEKVPLPPPIKYLAKKIVDKMGYTVLLKGSPPDVLRETGFAPIMEKSREYTKVDEGRSFGLYKAVEYLCRNNIEGDFVECGVWRGGQAMIMAYTLLQENDVSRTIWLYDTYAGMSEPTEDDVSILTKEKAKTLLLKDKSPEGILSYAPMEEVKRNVVSTGYSPNNFAFVKGKVEDTIPDQMPKKVALLRLDTDWYESTYHELVHLFPRLVKGGVLIIDDYGSWEGSRKAVDQYIKEKNVKILLNRVSNGRIGVRVD
ncbi:MAG: TylF/MycF/NovP-related O-methyltransferase [Minisyncoccia bacterium]